MQLYKPAPVAVHSRSAAPVQLLRPLHNGPRTLQLLPHAASQASDMKAVVEQDSTDLAAKKAATNITIYSAAQYVEGFLKQPLKEAGFNNLNFTEVKLDPSCAKLAEDSQVICIFVNDTCDAQTVARLAKCGVKLIALRCAGFDRVDLEACEQHGIKVVRVPTYSPTSVAEHAAALLMALNRHIALAYVRVAAGNYSLTPLVGVELRGKKVAVLGTGAIGTEACRIFKGIGMDVIAYDIKQNPAVEAMGIPYTSMDEALQQADVVSVHVPLLKSTHHFINQERICMMKKGAILLNVSRGGLVDADALLEGLENGQLGGLGMDVYENEGDLFFTDWSDMPTDVRMKNWDRRFKLLTSYPQVIITPHSAFLTSEALSNIASTTISNIEEFLAGKPLTNELKPKPSKAAGAAR